MLRISIEWWILYAFLFVIAFLVLRIFVNGVRMLRGELRETRNTVRELGGPEVLRELKAIKYIMEGLESNCDGFMLKEKSIAQDIRSEQKFSPDTPHVRNLQGEGQSHEERRTQKSH